ncbi:MAG: hypothetical protein U1F52_19055 [Burkholderiales bacterium]
MTTDRKGLLLSILGLAAILFSTMPLASSLLGTSTLDNTDDLTVVEGGGKKYEFLDLTPTYGGLSVPDAVGLYSGRGFYWATGIEVAILFSAFNINYGLTPEGVFSTGANEADSIALASLLGIYEPHRQFHYASGWIDDGSSSGFHTYACVGSNIGCVGDQVPSGTFVSNVTDAASYWPASVNVGTFLVRVVPEPSVATLTLVGLSVVGLLGRLRVRSR